MILLEGGDSMKKLLLILITIAFMISMISVGVFAAPEPGSQSYSNIENNKSDIKIDNNSDNKNYEKSDNEYKDKCDNCDKDPIEKLEEKKQEIQKELKEGKISKEKADELTKKIDRRIERIKKFNSLSLPEKKEHLSKNFKLRLEQQIKDGRITNEEGEKLLADFNKQLESWDGKQPPKFIHNLKKHKD